MRENSCTEGEAPERASAGSLADQSRLSGRLESLEQVGGLETDKPIFSPGIRWRRLGEVIV
jgi:hypothetical protein